MTTTTITTGTAINANQRKCLQESLKNVDDIWARAWELLEDYNISKLSLVSKGTVILFVDDCVIFNSIIDAPNGEVDIKSIINVLAKCNTESKIKSFNADWSIEAVTESNEIKTLIKSSTVSAYVLPTLNFTALESKVTNQNVVMTCSYDELAEMMGVSDHKNLAPAIQFEARIVRRWKKTGVPLIVARRCSALLGHNTNLPTLQ